MCLCLFMGNVLRLRRHVGSVFNFFSLLFPFIGARAHLKWLDAVGGLVLSIYSTPIARLHFAFAHMSFPFPRQSYAAPFSALRV